MASFEDLYAAWSSADQAAREAEAAELGALQKHAVVPPHLHNEAVALRGIANRLLDETMATMRLDAQRRRALWRWRLAGAA